MNRRLPSLRLENYRSIRGRHTINLDAPVVLIHGANGSGKTSLLSALEMGLTGDAAAMRRSDSNYASHLVHTGVDEAIIEVRCRHDAFEPLHSALTIRSGEMIGEPALPQQFRRLYTERCFLAQTTLSQLLDIYEQRSGKADDALTRFVRDLIGLDQFDSLLAGIHHTRHIARLRSALPVYGQVEHEIDRKERELREIDQSLRTESGQLSELNELLKDGLETLGHSRDAIEVDLVSWLSTEGDERRTVTLRSISREISSALAQWKELDDSADLERLTVAESEAKTIEHQWNAWQTQHYDSITRALSLFSATTAEASFSDSDDYAEAVRSALGQLENQAARINAQLKADHEVAAMLMEAREASEKAAGRLARLDLRIEGISGDTGALARALSEIEPFLVDETCPVCHRDFSETDGPPLHSHLTEHISQLAVAAEDLRELTAQRQSEVRVKEAADLRIADFEKRRRAATQLAEDEKHLTRIGEARVALETVWDAADAGSKILDRRRRALAELSSLRRNVRTLEGLRESILQFPNRLGLDSPTIEEGIEDMLNHCSNVAFSSIQEFDNRIALKLTAIQTLKKISSQMDQIKRMSNDQEERVQSLKLMKQALRRSDETRSEARKLAGYVEEVRTRIVSRVFSEQLNAMWRDLFVRLAPDEQFVPAFKVPQQTARKLEVQLETRLRDGASAGHPKSILSSGNLNTAALTLFLSLHLTVEPVLPWLVIDDPVQSMDEIHTSQFAALVRTLARQGGRQIIIAVHEQALFDYLTLELAPSSRNDRLNTIRLFKEAGKDTMVAQDTRIWDPSSVFSLPEAQRA